jgi:GT2 family glycosyltransferase
MSTATPGAAEFCHEMVPKGLLETLGRLLRGRRTPSDWMGPDAAVAAAARAGPMPVDNRHEILVLPPSLPEDEEALRRLEADGHRVFFVLPEEATFEALDALRRDRSLGATLVVAADPSWQPLAERLRLEQNWPSVRSLAAPPAKAFPLLSVVLVTCGNRELNRLCLESLAARTEWPSLEVLVVDNGSVDGTRELLEAAAARDARIRPILFGENRGYPAAANAGLAAARGESLVLLNNDTVVTRGWATALLRHLARDPRLGLVGPVTNAISNEARIEVGYRDLEALPAWAAAWTRAHDGETFEIPSLAFFCAAMPRAVYEKVGPLDERFGLGMFEDGDYNRRVRAAGYDVRCARDAFVHHWQMASFRRLGRDAYFRLFEENRRKFEEKWRPRGLP